MKIQLATVISRVFEPALTIALVFIAGAVHAGLSPIASVSGLAIVLGPTLVYRFWLKKARGIDWDIKHREQRVGPFLALLGFLAVAILIAWVVEPRLLWMFGIFFVWTVGFCIITASWTKISGHTGGNALAGGLMVFWYGWQWWPVLLSVPIVAWARVVRGDHTIAQVVQGAVYSWGLLILVQLVK